MQPPEEINKAIYDAYLERSPSDDEILRYVDEIRFVSRCETSGLCVWRFNYLGAPMTARARVSSAIFDQLPAFAHWSIDIIRGLAEARPPDHIILRKMIINRAHRYHSAVVTEINREGRARGTPIALALQNGGREIVDMHPLAGLRCYAGYHEGTDQLFVEYV